ncbi:hypothetical protein [Rhodococcus koreensis]|uniref:hypothetical protein n=1 Tax=Rhodococcus koreensis TaxID=99653 RepID=UPI00366BD903
MSTPYRQHRKRWVLRTVSASRAEDLAEVTRSLTAAEQVDRTLRAETLADAISWLDFLLDADLPDLTTA